MRNAAQQADGHEIQSRIFAAQGFKKLEEKYAEHADEERGYDGRGDWHFDDFTPTPGEDEEVRK